jgi:hypothetical protein
LDTARGGIYTLKLHDGKDMQPSSWIGCDIQAALTAIDQPRFARAFPNEQPPDRAWL